MHKHPLAAIAIGLVLSTPALAQTTSTTATVPRTIDTKAALTNNERYFLDASASGADYEVAISRLALQKSERPDIKSYAQHVIDDHTQMNGQLRQVATAHGIQLPQGMTAEQQTHYSHLQGLTGHAFDTAYIADIRDINQQDASQFRTESAELTAPQLKNLLQQMHQVDERHMQEAQNLKG